MQEGEIRDQKKSLNGLVRRLHRARSRLNSARLGATEAFHRNPDHPDHPDEGEPQVAAPPPTIDRELFVPPGHFYSPLPDPGDAALAVERAERADCSPLPGIAMDDAAILRQWQRMLPLMANAPFKIEKTKSARYHLDNEYFSYGDALVYYAMLALNKPKRLIEIGSGFSSAVALDTREHLGLDLHLTFVEPYPEVLRGLIRQEELARCDLLEQKVQSVPLDLFRTLDRNDILFIDSSHVAKAGSDVCCEIFDILPHLKSGVLIHIHDMAWPFEYQRDWVVNEKRAWNELYFIRAFLMYNKAFEIEFFNHYFYLRYPDEASDPKTQFRRNCGAGLWLRKV